MKSSLVFIVSLFCSQIVAEELSKADEIAQATQLCDVKVRRLCSDKRESTENGPISCIQREINNLDEECRLLIDKEMRKGNLIGSKMMGPASEFNFPDLRNKEQ